MELECYVIQGIGYVSLVKVINTIADRVQCEVVEFDTADNELYYFDDVSYHISRLKSATHISYREFQQVANAAKEALEKIENEKIKIWKMLTSIS